MSGGSFTHPPPNIEFCGLQILAIKEDVEHPSVLVQPKNPTDKTKILVKPCEKCVVRIENNSNKVMDVKVSVDQYTLPEMVVMPHTGGFVSHTTLTLLWNDVANGIALQKPTIKILVQKVDTTPITRMFEVVLEKAKPIVTRQKKIHAGKKKSIST